MKQVLIIVGTRPEAIKLFPVFKALKASPNFRTLLLTTGQHGTPMIAPLMSFFGVKADVDLDVSNQSLTQFLPALMLSLGETLAEIKPDVVVVQGDTTSCMAGSLCAFYHGIKIAHVEAGLRTYNRHSPYPEEVNRRVTSLMADVHFSPTERARQNLLEEKVGGRIEVVGNTVIDSLLEACRRTKEVERVYRMKYNYLLDGFKRIILITGHRRENIGSNFLQIYAAIRQLAKMYDNFCFVYPLHTNPVVRSMANSVLKGIDNVFLIEPLPYDEMVFLMQECYLMMTDSGGVQEECPSLNKPVLILRDTTERPEGVEAGCSLLAGVKSEGIIAAFNSVVMDERKYSKMSSVKNPYGNGDSSGRIAHIIEAHMLN